MAVPRFYVPAIDPHAGLVALPADEAHHLTRVLRLSIGADVVIFDGRGREWLAQVSAASRQDAHVVIAHELRSAAEPAVHVTLAMAMLKGDHMDAVVRDATMMGAAAIVPMRTDHVALPHGARDASSVERWRRVAVASAKQCQRAVVPRIAEISTLQDVVNDVSGTEILFCVEPSIAGAATMASMAGPPRASIVVVIGPEGGWSDEEVALVSNAGARLVHLGPRTLRADAAPIVALSALWTIWGW